MTSFNLILAELLRFLKVTSESLKNWETFRYLSNFKFSGVISNEFLFKVKLIQNKNLFFEKIYYKKPRGGKNTPSYGAPNVK